MAANAALRGRSVATIRGEEMPPREKRAGSAEDAPGESKTAAEKPAAQSASARKVAAPRATTARPTAKSAGAGAAAAPRAAAKKPRATSGQAAAEKPAADDAGTSAADSTTAGIAAAESGTVEATAAEAAAGAVAENPLHRKLGLRPGLAGVVIAPPEDDDNPLLPLPKGFSALAQTADLAAVDGLLDYLHVFARDRADLIETFPLLRDKLAPGGSLWISWVKQSSGGRGGSLLGDLNENVIRRMALMNGLVDVKVAALDRDWSALRLVRRKR
jgi:hypothetical protein